MLDGTLEDDGRGQRVDIGSDTARTFLIVGTVELVEGRAAKVHRAYDIACEGIHRTAVARLVVAEALGEVQVL